MRNYDQDKRENPVQYARLMQYINMMFIRKFIKMT